MSFCLRFGLPYIAALSLAACGGSSVGQQLPAQGSILNTAPYSEGELFTVPKVAGTYAGTISEVEGSHKAAGTVKIVVKQKGSNISGDFDVTFGSKTKDLTLSGTVKAAKKGASLAFTIFNFGGRNAQAKATVTGSKLNGTGHVPQESSMPAVSLKFSTTKM